MPQLMPLYWVMNFVSIMFLIMVGLKLYFIVVELTDNKMILELSYHYWKW